MYLLPTGIFVYVLLLFRQYDEHVPHVVMASPKMCLCWRKSLLFIKERQKFNK